MRTREDAFHYVQESYITMDYRTATRRRLYYWVSFCLEDFAQEAKLPSDPSPYRREPEWQEDDRVLFTNEGRDP
jgi:hypothetical protein